MTLWPKPLFGDEVILRSIDWLENLPWKKDCFVKSQRDKYEICLHIKDFAPEEISVKIKDGFILVEGKHKEKKEEHCYVSRSVLRKYPLPEQCRTDSIESKLSQEGILTITVPRISEDKRDTIIPVSYEGSSVKSKL